MHIGLFLVFWIALGIVLVAWAHLRSTTPTHNGRRRQHSRPQAVLDPTWSRGLPGVRAR